MITQAALFHFAKFLLWLNLLEAEPTQNPHGDLSGFV